MKRCECRGRQGYDNVMLLMVVLFARMTSFGDLRSLESLCRHDIRFMYITQEETSSFMAFERLLKDYLIDDTKFEANSNKYSFVYKTRIINARKKQKKRS